MLCDKRNCRRVIERLTRTCRYTALVEVVGDENPDDEDETGMKDNAPSDDQGDNQGEDAGSTVEDPAAGQNNGDPETQNEQQDADVQNGTEDPSGDAPSDQGSYLLLQRL